MCRRLCRLSIHPLPYSTPCVRVEQAALGHGLVHHPKTRHRYGERQQIGGDMDACRRIEKPEERAVAVAGIFRYDLRDDAAASRPEKGRNRVGIVAVIKRPRRKAAQLVGRCKENQPLHIPERLERVDACEVQSHPFGTGHIPHCLADKFRSPLITLFQRNEVRDPLGHLAIAAVEFAASATDVLRIQAHGFSGVNPIQEAENAAAEFPGLGDRGVGIPDRDGQCGPLAESMTEVLDKGFDLHTKLICPKYTKNSPCRKIVGRPLTRIRPPKLQRAAGALPRALFPALPLSR